MLAVSSSNSKNHPFSIGASFNTAAQWTSRQCGRASTFAFACVLIVAWAATGPIFQYSDTWQLVINTGTTIVTFLMVFLIQNTHKRGAQDEGRGSPAEGRRLAAASARKRRQATRDALPSRTR